MTDKDFEKYRFSIKTEVMVNGVWHGVTEVDFDNWAVGCDNGYYLKYDKIEDIRQKQDL